MTDLSVRKHIYTVSELTGRIKGMLEENFPFVWICGEISNLRIPASRHCYFTLKDEKAQISGVMFKGQARNLKFEIEDGLSVNGLGRIGVYEPRGSYQVIFEYLEPRGIGALQVAFEQLKARLAAQGLFDAEHKRPIPFLPEKIAIITSASGAVVFDIIDIVSRRFPGVKLCVIPVRVQGRGAEEEIVSAIDIVNGSKDVDCAVLARGGGSLEDFHAFNSEMVANAVFNCKVPIISAIGHETDFSISDFVADLRAPTPSAAAELAVPVRADLENKVARLSLALQKGFERRIETRRRNLVDLSKRLAHPARRIEDMRLKLDDYETRLYRLTDRYLKTWKERLSWQAQRLFSNTPLSGIDRLRTKTLRYNENMEYAMKSLISRQRMNVKELDGRLYELDPKKILLRGYSITRTIPGAEVVRNARSLEPGQMLETVLADGSFISRVESVKKDDIEH